MGACFDRLRCEVFQNLFLSPMNTGFVRPAVATVLTVYGIETLKLFLHFVSFNRLQQYLPFTVLKLTKYIDSLKGGLIKLVMAWQIDTGSKVPRLISTYLKPEDKIK